MGFVVLSVLVQVLTVVHIIRTGRNQLWIMAAVFLSIPGCIAYSVVELGPELWGGRAAQERPSGDVARRGANASSCAASLKRLQIGVA